MKKIILILLAALPVLIVFFTAIGASGIIGEIKTFPVERIDIDYQKLKEVGQETGPSQNFLTLERGESLDLSEYIKVFPSKAEFSSLKFISLEPEIVDVVDGVLTAKQYMRSFTRIFVEIRNSDSLTVLEKFGVSVRGPKMGEETDLIDYIGFNLDAYEKNQIFGQYCSVEDGKLIIDKEIINDINANDKLNVLAGLTVGPWAALNEVSDMFVVTSDILEERAAPLYAVLDAGTALVTVAFRELSATLEIVVR